MTARMAGVGDDRRVHWWTWTPEEPMVRVCDGVESTDVELYARDQHGDRKACETCNVGVRR
jgi:hypothetical protein